MVISRSGGLRMSRWRSLEGVSPVRIATSGAVNASPIRSAARPMPVSGALRFFSMSNASALSGEMYSTRVRWLRASGRCEVTSRSIDARNAVSVLPEPVGAQIRVCSPAAMLGHPSIWGGVGAGNEDANHSRTAGENSSSTGWAAISRPYRRGVTAISGPADRPCGERIAGIEQGFTRPRRRHHGSRVHPALTRRA